MVGKIIEGTVTLVALYLVVANASNFSTVVNAVGGQYANAVKTLQARS